MSASGSQNTTFTVVSGCLLLLGDGCGGFECTAIKAIKVSHHFYHNLSSLSKWKQENFLMTDRK
jgi:hypothetical protein